MSGEKERGEFFFRAKAVASAFFRSSAVGPLGRGPARLSPPRKPPPPAPRPPRRPGYNVHSLACPLAASDWGTARWDLRARRRDAARLAAALSRRRRVAPFTHPSWPACRPPAGHRQPSRRLWRVLGGWGRSKGAGGERTNARHRRRVPSPADCARGDSTLHHPQSTATFSSVDVGGLVCARAGRKGRVACAVRHSCARKLLFAGRGTHHREAPTLPVRRPGKGEKGGGGLEICLEGVLKEQKQELGVGRTARARLLQ